MLIKFHMIDRRKFVANYKHFELPNQLLLKLESDVNVLAICIPNTSESYKIMYIFWFLNSTIFIY